MKFKYLYLGLKACITCSLHSINGPSSRSMQYGIAGNTASRHCRIALGLPGKFRTKVRLRMPAVCRERIAVGTYVRLFALINSPKPGNILLHTASVASGVTSRTAGPVPPDVIIRQHFSLSDMLIRVYSINC